MNREIKFRAWDKTTLKMYDRTQFTKHTSFPFISLCGTMWADTGSMDEMSDCLILMQYTGLTDKNGKEIYEGDILNIHVFTEELDGATLGVREGEREFRGHISFQELGLWIECDSEEDSRYLLHLPGMVHEESYEVIGNIYENKNLLK